MSPFGNTRTLSDSMFLEITSVMLTPTQACEVDLPWRVPIVRYPPSLFLMINCRPSLNNCWLTIHSDHLPWPNDPESKISILIELLLLIWAWQSGFTFCVLSELLSNLGKFEPPFGYLWWNLIATIDFVMNFSHQDLWHLSMSFSSQHHSHISLTDSIPIHEIQIPQRFRQWDNKK